MRRLGPLNAERWYQVAGNNLPRTQEVPGSPREEYLAPRAGQEVAQPVAFSMIGLHRSILLLNLALQNHAKIRAELLTFRCDLKSQHATQLRPGAVLLISTVERILSTLALH